MIDSDNDSFHSASEGEELADDIKHVKKVVEMPSTPISPIIEEPKKEEILDVTGPYDDANQSADWAKKQSEKKLDISGPYSDANQSAEWTKKQQDDEQLSPDLPKKELKSEEGWEDFGEQADTEGDSEPEIEKDESEYFHRQLMDPKKIPASLISSDADKNDKDEASKGLFDWSAIQNVVNAVGEGISNVVETGLGIPPAEEAAKLSVAERRKILEDAQQVKEPEPLSSDEGSGQSPEGSTHHFPMYEQPQQHNTFGNFFGGFGSIVNGSLDVLETIGKKTFETLTVKTDSEKRRFILQPGNDQNLSEILRELKETEDAPPGSPTKMLGYSSIFARQNGISFLKEFENFDGLTHLECFELLSKDYFAEKVGNKQFSKFDERIANFCLEDVSECLTEEFLKEIKKQSNKFNIGYKPTPLINANAELTDELSQRQQAVDKGGEINVEEFHRFAIIALAKLTSKAIEVSILYFSEHTVTLQPFLVFMPSCTTNDCCSISS
jgi:hypothetical protein